MDLDAALRIIRSSPETAKAVHFVLDEYIKRNLNMTVEGKEPWEVARAQGGVKTLRYIKDHLENVNKKRT